MQAHEIIGLLLVAFVGIVVALKIELSFYKDDGDDEYDWWGDRGRDD